MTELPAPVKEYNDVIVLARGVVSSTMKEVADGFQVKDLFPILEDNFSAAMAAYTGGDQIKVAWKDHQRECIDLTIDFAVDVACDILKLDNASSEPGEFKETKEMLAAVSGVTSSVLSKLPGGFQSSEILPVVLENFQGLMVGLEGADKIGAEFKTNIRAFIKMVASFAVKMAFDLKEKLAEA